jgi:hypothetical protein
MKLNKFLLTVIVGVFYTSAHSYHVIQDPCSGINIIPRIVHTTSTSTGLGSVSFDTSNSREKAIRFVFCNSEGRVLNVEDLETNSFTKLRPGKYSCIVSFENGCNQKIDLTIN